MQAQNEKTQPFDKVAIKKKEHCKGKPKSDKLRPIKHSTTHMTLHTAISKYAVKVVGHQAVAFDCSIWTSDHNTSILCKFTLL